MIFLFNQILNYFQKISVVIGQIFYGINISFSGNSIANKRKNNFIAMIEKINSKS